LLIPCSFEANFERELLVSARAFQLQNLRHLTIDANSSLQFRMIWEENLISIVIVIVVGDLYAYNSTSGRKNLADA
jgi:hypothetical protein